MGHLVSLYTAHGTLVIYISDFSVPKWKSIYDNEAFFQTLFSFVDHLPMSPHDHHCCLGGKTWNRVSPIISSLKLDRWVSAFYIFLPSLSSKVTGRPLYNRLRDLDMAKNNNNMDFLETSLRASRGKNKRRRRVTVNDFYLLLTTKVIFSSLFFHNKFCLFFVPVKNCLFFCASEESIFCAGEELTKVYLVLFHLSQTERVQAWRFGNICIQQQPRIF